MPKTIQRFRSKAFIQQCGKCCYCHFPLVLPGHRGPAPLRCTAEHLQARSAGGSNFSSNIAAACAWCNSVRHRRKHPSEPSVYAEQVQRRVAEGRWHSEGVRKWAVTMALKTYGTCPK